MCGWALATFENFVSPGSLVSTEYEALSQHVFPRINQLRGCIRDDRRIARARRPARHASQCLKDAAPDYLRFFELSGVWYIMFGIVAPQHTMQKASYFVMLAGLYRKPSPLTCAPRAVPGDGGGEPSIDAVRGRRAWCPPWSCCTPGPSFGPWARRPGCPAGKFHPRPWPCL